MDPQRDLERATISAFVLAAGGFVVASSPGLIAGPIGACTIAALGALALLYLVIGVRGAAGTSDPMTKFWPALFAAGAGFLLAGQFYLPPWLGAFNIPLRALYVATLAAGGLRFVLALRQVQENKMPDPKKIGLPNAGPASPQTAHQRLTRSGGYRRPKFRTS